jgi:hypothetical protein
MSKIIKLSEADLTRIVRRVIQESQEKVNIPMAWELSKKLGYKYSTPMGPDTVFFHYGDNWDLSSQKLTMDVINGKPTKITVMDERGEKSFPATILVDTIVNYANKSKKYKKLNSSPTIDR